MSATANAIVQQLLGELDDRPDGFAYCRCPGESLHSTPTGKRDCRVYYQTGAPTIYCLHSSCAGAVESANKTLRSTLGKMLAGAKIEPVRFPKSPEQKAQEAARREAAQLAVLAKGTLPKILSAYPWPCDQIFTDSPEGVAEDPKEDWRLMLTLFQPHETVWIGDKRDSGSIRHSSYFRTAAKWLAAGVCPKGPLILPASIKAGAWSRKKDDIERLPFLVVESDTLGKDEIGAVFRWLRECVGMKLVAVLDTAGRSLHGWFVRPDEGTMRDLKTALPAMGCDGAVLRHTQPVRLPGCPRPGKEAIQALLYLNREVLQ